MAKILVDEDLVIGALMCCLGTKVLFDTLAKGTELPKELFVESAGLIQEVLDATPDELREMVINAMVDGADLLEEVPPPQV